MFTLTFSQILNVVLTIIATSVTTAFIAFCKKIVTEFKFLRNSQRIMIKDRIVEAHDYSFEKGSIGKYSLSTVEELFGEYSTLGGNGFVHGLMDDIRDLPID